jgi:hypothetical protein
MTKLILAALTAAALGAALSTGNAAGRCPPEACTNNGTQLTGIALQDAIQLVVGTVTLPSGQIFGMATQTIEQPRMQLAGRRATAVSNQIEKSRTQIQETK